jgi:mTERF domain-containing protein
MEHQEYESLSDAEYGKLSKRFALEPSWRPIVSYLVSIGLKAADLEKVVLNCEEIFTRPVSRVITRVEYLQSELGLDRNTLRQTVNKDPRILLQRNRHSIPRCRYLTKIGIPPEKLGEVLGKQPSILHLSVQNGLMPRVQYLKEEVGILPEDIPGLIQRSPAVLTFSVENQIQPRVEFLRGLGISKENVVKMLTRHPQMLHYSFEGLEEHLKFLGEIGMNDGEAAVTVTRLSQFFSLSVEDSLRPKFNYLTNELGGNKDTCVKYPAYFSLSLDQRIRPRHQFLERYDLAPDPFPMRYLSIKDDEFLRRAERSLEEFEAFKQEMIPIFEQQTARDKTLRQVTMSAEQQRVIMERKRVDSSRSAHEEAVRKREYSERVAKARQSLRLLGRSQHRSR